MAYLFGAICPALGKGAGLVLPFCNTAAMAPHLREISHAVAPGAHAVVLLDQAGWHLSADLAVPDNITILSLPAKCPELNPVENIWQFMRDNWLSNRVLTSYDNIVDHCCYAWHKIVALDHHVHRAEPMGAWGLINGYYPTRIHLQNLGIEVSVSAVYACSPKGSLTTNVAPQSTS